MSKKNPALEKVREKLVTVREELQGRKIIFDGKRDLVMIPEGQVNGLWPECQALTFEAFNLVRCKRDWLSIRTLCVRSIATKLLYDLLASKYPLKKKKTEGPCEILARAFL